MSVDNWQDENMPANIVNSRISSNSAVKRHECRTASAHFGAEVTRPLKILCLL
ncbi:hypothetical protein PVAP13_2NG376003 [Panicum virgatum]|uniref:Uncharacterized protein n=1 Tax=Panicum virgatum TaxID=38727 RepID=A0A8T0VKK7_PANVG|nr:hypothetical protein PVAP13_2NG376003 [Panicum virgatum]